MPKNAPKSSIFREKRAKFSRNFFLIEKRVPPWYIPSTTAVTPDTAHTGPHLHIIYYFDRYSQPISHLNRPKYRKWNFFQPRPLWLFLIVPNCPIKPNKRRPNPLYGILMIHIVPKIYNMIPFCQLFFRKFFLYGHFHIFYVPLLLPDI